MRLTLLTMLILCMCVCVSTWAGKSRENGDFKTLDAGRTLPLKGVLALLIIMDHLAIGVRGMSHPSVMNEFIDVGRMSVGAFFFLSGYGLMASYKRRGRLYLRGFVGRRLWKTLPALVIATALWLVRSHFATGEDIVASLGELSRGYTPLPSSWFVYVILLFYLIFYVSARLGGDERIVAGTVWILVTAYVVLAHDAGFGYIWYIGVYTFCIGVTYGCFEDMVRRRLGCGRRRLTAAMVGLTVLSALPYFYNLHVEHIRHTYFAAMHLSPLVVVMAIYAMGMVRWRALDFLGRISYEIYLVHPALVVLVAPLTDNWAVVCVAVLAGTIPAAWLLHEVCERLTKIRA